MIRAKGSNAPASVPSAPVAKGSDLDQQIEEACATEDPRLCNLRVTVGHYALSLALHDALGADTGANFHTWAVWGSKKAGTTIRREDLSGARGALLRTVARPALPRGARDPGRQHHRARRHRARDGALRERLPGRRAA
jgi:hypothetical protein